MKEITYLIYIVFWELLTLGGCAYCVFVLDATGLWFILGVVMSMSAYKPAKWIHGLDS